MKTLKRLFILIFIIIIVYGTIYFWHPMPFIPKIDIQSAEVTDRSNVIMYKTDDPQKVDKFFNLFKYNIPYLPWQQNSSWKKITPAVKSGQPDIVINFLNDLGVVRYSFAVRFNEPSYVQIQEGFFAPWSKTYFPLNPAIGGWRKIAGKV